MEQYKNGLKFENLDEYNDFKLNDERFYQSFMINESIVNTYNYEHKQIQRFNTENIFDESFLDGLLVDIEKIEEEIQYYDNETLEFGKVIAEQALKEFTPYETGNLLNHWKVSINYETKRINMVNDCKYATIQNYGFDRNIKNIGIVWMPGCYMLERSQHRTAIMMKEFYLNKKGIHDGKNRIEDETARKELTELYDFFNEDLSNIVKLVNNHNYNYDINGLIYLQCVFNKTKDVTEKQKIIYEFYKLKKIYNDCKNIKK